MTDQQMTEEQWQEAANIMYRYMVYEAPQGILNVESLLANVQDQIQSELQIDFKQNKANLVDIAKQVTAPLPNSEKRLFAIEHIEQEDTEIRNELAFIFLEGPKKTYQKTEILSKLKRFNKQKVENILKAIGQCTGKHWKIKAAQ